MQVGNHKQARRLVNLLHSGALIVRLRSSTGSSARHATWGTSLSTVELGPVKLLVNILMTQELERPT
jgi:hypothetical protein